MNLFCLKLVINGFIVCAIQVFASHRLAAKEPGSVIIFTFFFLLEVLLIIAIARQPKSEKSSYFEVSLKILIERKIR